MESRARIPARRPPDGPPHDRRSPLEQARDLYAAGRIDLRELEQRVSQALKNERV